MTRKWSGIKPDEDRVRIAVLTHYAEAGHAPSHERLVEITGFERDEVVHLLGQLQERRRDVDVERQGVHDLATPLGYRSGVKDDQRDPE